MAARSDEAAEELLRAPALEPCATEKAAVLLGGVSIFGGRGNVGGVLAAVLLLVTLQTGLLQLNVNSVWQVGIVGALLVAVLAADGLTNRRR